MPFTNQSPECFSLCGFLHRSDCSAILDCSAVWKLPMPHPYFSFPTGWRKLLIDNMTVERAGQLVIQLGRRARLCRHLGCRHGVYCPACLCVCALDSVLLILVRLFLETKDEIVLFKAVRDLKGRTTGKHVAGAGRLLSASRADAVLLLPVHGRSG